MRTAMKVLRLLGVILFIGAAVLALVKTSLLWGAVSIAGLVLTIVVGEKDGPTVDYNATSDSGYLR